MESFLRAFIPLFMAFDGVGLLPFFWGVTQRLNSGQRQRAIIEAVVTASLVAAGFLLVSRWVFSLMGLELADIMVAGGAILIVLCLRELLLTEEMPRVQISNPGVVPLGVPLLSGPAVLTTVLLVRNQYGWGATVVALAANMAVIWAILRAAAWLMPRLGQHGSEIISKISSVILTAFGVMLIRRGVLLLFP